MPDEPGRREIALEWFRRGEHDLGSARILFEQEGYMDTIAVLLQQAVEKHLKGYLLYNGWIRGNQATDNGMARAFRTKSDPV